MNLLSSHFAILKLEESVLSNASCWLMFEKTVLFIRVNRKLYDGSGPLSPSTLKTSLTEDSTLSRGYASIDYLHRHTCIHWRGHTE